MTSTHDHQRDVAFTDASIRRLVDAFYDRVRQDPEIGPIFEAVIGGSAGGWPPHLDKLTAFWCAVLLHKPGYQGNPRVAHEGVPGISPRHFERWLQLFRLEAHQVFEPAPAQEVVMRAEMMAANLQRALFLQAH